jgi:hypothetical protein
MLKKSDNFGAFFLTKILFMIYSLPRPQKRESCELKLKL